MVTPEKVNVYKGFRAFEKSRSESRLHAPKARALPTALHPEVRIILYQTDKRLSSKKYVSIVNFLPYLLTKLIDGVILFVLNSEVRR